MIWVPAEKPFRVSAVRRTGSYGMQGWRHAENQVFATIDEAKAYAATIKGAKSVRIDQAINADNWAAKGFWKKI